MLADRPGDVKTRRTVLAALNAGLHQAFAADERVLLLGEDVLDPYGGAFKVTKGLSSAYPERVLTTPISEAGIVGVASGMALRGLRPVVEIMFGDFLTLAADQIINHASKFRWMYNDQVRVPLVVRTPMGGRRGYGPTHSQTLEKLFLGVPGLRVVAPAAFGDPGELLRRIILESEDPLLFIENKLLYSLPLFDESDSEDLTIRIGWGTTEASSAAQHLAPNHGCARPWRHHPVGQQFMEEAERLSDRLAVIDSGRLVALDTPADIVSLAGGNSGYVSASMGSAPSGSWLKTAFRLGSWC